MIDESLNFEIWERLIQAKSLVGLPLEIKDGRLDLSGLDLTEPQVLRRFQFQNTSIAEIASGAIIQNSTWSNLDFSRSKLNGLRFLGCQIDNCRFDGCQLKDTRVWSTEISGSSFKGANLGKSMLGGVRDGKWNVYSEVDFSAADLRGTIYKTAAFSKCVFRDTKLSNIDFQTSAFTDCVFEGEIRDVLFYRRGFEGEAFPANEMINIDFSRAKLHDVGFRGLKLDRVKFPQDADHIVIKDVLATLERLIAALNRQGDTTAKQLIAFLNIDRKWIAPDQAQRCINTQDLEETVGEDGVNRLRELLQQLSPVR